MFKKAKIAVASILAAVICLSGCSGMPENRYDANAAVSGTSRTEESNASGAGDPDPDISNFKLNGSPAGTLLSFDGGDEVKISRINKADNGFKGEENVWTILVYMCASDLESKYGSATDDLIEMQDATKSCPNLRFVVEAGGTKEWNNTTCKSNQKQRILVQNGVTETVYTESSANMGKPETLTDFIVWGLENYPSEHMVLDFWDHGGGSITGVCFDENFDMDSLSLAEIDEALANSYEHMPRKFDMIGFDACLMATVETANILVPYGKYMVASQELEPGNGWDYNSFAKAINAGADSGDKLGTYLVDGFYNSCKMTNEEDSATLSVIDLSKIDAFIKAFNLYAKDAYYYASEHLNIVIKAAKDSNNFGGNNRKEGYTNMVDIGNLLLRSDAFAASSAKSALNALNDCVVYMKNGANENDARGLSLYYPLSIQGSRELDTFKSLCISPYYLGLVDLCAYGSSTNGYTSDYDYNELLNSFSDLWAGEALSGDHNYWENEEDNSLNFDQSESALAYEIAPHFDDNGFYTFKLTQRSLENLDTIYCSVMESYWDDIDGKEYLLDLGTDDYVDLDRSTGICRDAFDGLWICLPDGQMLCTYLVDWTETDGIYSNIYTCPIYLNGEYTYLQLIQTYYDDGTVTEALGTWDGVDEYGAAKYMYRLNEGDVIMPCYFAYDPDTFEYVRDYYGETYVYSSYDTFGFDYLEDADYYYSFEIYDCYDNTLYTDFVLFNVENGVPSYYY